jgi:hypothetical protein
MLRWHPQEISLLPPAVFDRRACCSCNSEIGLIGHADRRYGRSDQSVNVSASGGAAQSFERPSRWERNWPVAFRVAEDRQNWSFVGSCLRMERWKSAYVEFPLREV